MGETVVTWNILKWGDFVWRKDEKTLFTLFVDSIEVSHLSLSLNTVVHPAAKCPPQQFLSLSLPFNIDDSHRIK